MSYKFATRLLLVLILLLFTGTQLPNIWRVNIANGLNAPVILSWWSHFILFLVMACVATMQPLAWRWRRVLFAASGLALISEGLQFFTIDRHPRMLDVGIDLAGALIGFALVKIFIRYTKSQIL